MKITANLEFDTFAEAEKVFRHLGMLDGTLHDGVPKSQLKNVEVPKTNGAHPTPASGAGEANPAAGVPGTVASDDVSDEAIVESVNAAIKGGRLRALHINQIYEKLAGGVKRHRDVPQECRQKVKLALDTGTQERPLGEAA